MELSHDEVRWIRELEMAFEGRNREMLLLAAHKLVRATECRLLCEGGCTAEHCGDQVTQDLFEGPDKERILHTSDKERMVKI